MQFDPHLGIVARWGTLHGMKSNTTLVALKEERDSTIQALSEAFAQDLIDVDEYESRVVLANEATDCAALVALRQDLAPIDKEERAALDALMERISSSKGPRG